ncbi:MAG: glycosyltransferase family 39 protein [Saprospirales bacterium]|nr:glycosyltransferase family 39 protein [Saprospirales bacterium]
MFSKIRIAHVVLLAFLLRIIFFVIHQPWISEIEKTQVIAGDAVLYQYLAKSIMDHFSFANNEMRTPGYPFFLSIIYFIVGFKPWIVILIQIILNSYCVFLIYKITSKAFNETAGLFAAFIIAIDPHQILICHFLYPDILFSTLFLLTIYFYILGLENKKSSYFILVGCLIGINIIIKPVLQYLPFALIIFLLIWCKFSWKEKAVKSILILFFSIIFTLPWMYRNYSKFNHFSMSSISGLSLFFNSVPLTEATLTHQNFDSIGNQNLRILQQQYPNATHIPDSTQEMWKYSTFENEDYYSKFASAYLSEHKLAFAKATSLGMVRMMINMGTQNFLEKLHVKNQNKWNYNQRYTLGLWQQAKLFFATKTITEILLGVFILLFLSACYLFYAIGILNCFQQRKIIALLFIGCMFYFLLIYGILPVVRYKLPITMMYAPISGLGISVFINYFQSRKKIKHI